MRDGSFDICLDTPIYPNGYTTLICILPGMELADNGAAEFGLTFRSVSLNRSTICFQDSRIGLYSTQNYEEALSPSASKVGSAIVSFMTKP